MNSVIRNAAGAAHLAQLHGVHPLVPVQGGDEALLARPQQPRPDPVAHPGAVKLLVALVARLVPALPPGRTEQGGENIGVLGWLTSEDNMSHRACPPCVKQLEFM